MELNELMNRYAQSGAVTYISIREKRLHPVKQLREVEAIASKGLSGDRYRSNGGTRQVTLIQEEHLQAVASFLGRDSIDPDLLRRNLVVRGINLLSLKGKTFRVGTALLEYSGECHPCSRMEENLGPGGYNAMRGHGGITAKIIESGVIRLMDRVYVEAS